MNKTYIKPMMVTAQLLNMETFLQSVSSDESLSGTTYGGKTEGSGYDPDAKKRDTGSWDEGGLW